MRDFEVARHQPHPPGYPVYIALGKVSTALYAAAGSAAVAVNGLAIWSALAVAVLTMAMFSFCRSVFGDGERALIAAVLTVVTPLMWFTSLRPMSDVPGLAMAFVSLALVARACLRADNWNRRRTGLLVAGAFIAAMSVGFRSQMALLTLPFAAWAAIQARIPARVRASAAGTIVVGGLAWGVPLIIESGGLEEYARALGGQAGEDFTGVVMLWTHPTPRVALTAFLNTFTLPWDSPLLAGVVLSVAGGGFVLCALRARAACVAMLVTFVPYLAFHLLFQETLTTRYALPIVPLVAMCAAVCLASATRSATAVATLVLVAACLSLAVPTALAYRRTASPAFAALSEMELVDRGGQPLIGMHRRIWSETRRARSWTGAPRGRLLSVPRDYEWLEVTRAWRGGDTARTWFLADPRRTDLALIDSEYRRTREYRWPLDHVAYLGGGRPDELDWHIYDAPGWFLEQGWALTPEIAGITERDGWGPHRTPSVGWIRRRSEPTLLMLGGRHLGGADEPAARISVLIDDRLAGSFDADPGFFLRFFPLDAAALAGDGTFARLTVSARSVRDGSPPPRVSLEQFNLQSRDIVQFGFADGWQEPEYNPRAARLWRWMSETAHLQVHTARRNVIIEIRGESPMRYYDEAPLLRVTAGERVLGEWRPDRDFVMEVSAPADALAASAGMVTLHSSAFFVPGEREGTADRRRLALRIYSVRVHGVGGQSP